MTLADYKNRKIKIGERVRIEQDIPSVNGMLYKDSIVKIDEYNETNETIRVIDRSGKIWWVSPNHVSRSFL